MYAKIVFRFYCPPPPKKSIFFKILKQLEKKVSENNLCMGEREGNLYIFFYKD